jgi:hypothetical protein
MAESARYSHSALIRMKHLLHSITEKEGLACQHSTLRQVEVRWDEPGGISPTTPKDSPLAAPAHIH